jgi:hypothetical protein
MFMRISGIALAVSLSFLQANAKKTGPIQLKSDTSTICVCDLLRHPDRYDGKKVKFRAKYVSAFEVSAFITLNCTDEENSMWVEFDRSLISISSKPEVLRKVEEQVYCCLLSGLSYIRKTEMLVTGTFHKPNKEGYGHDNKYRFLVTVKSIEEIGNTEKINAPGFDQEPD